MHARLIFWSHCTIFTKLPKQIDNLYAVFDPPRVINQTKLIHGIILAFVATILKTLKRVRY